MFFIAVAHVLRCYHGNLKFPLTYNEKSESRSLLLSHCRYSDITFLQMLSSPPTSIKKLYKFLILICCHGNRKSKMLNQGFIAVHSGEHCEPNFIFINRPRHKKTCLRGVRPGKTKTNLQRLARVLKFRI